MQKSLLCALVGCLSTWLPSTLLAADSWPQALLPPGVRTETAAPGGMIFPCQLAELKLPMAPTDAPPPAPHICFSPDGKALAVAASQHGVLRLDVYSGKTLWQTSRQQPPRALAYAADGQAILLLEGDAVVALANDTGEMAWTWTAPTGGGRTPVRLLATTTGILLASGGRPAEANGQAVWLENDGRQRWIFTPPEGWLLLAAEASDAGDTIVALIASRQATAGPKPSFASTLLLLDPATGAPATRRDFAVARQPAATPAMAELGLAADGSLATLALPGIDPTVFHLTTPDTPPYVLTTGGGLLAVTGKPAGSVATFVGCVPASTDDDTKADRQDSLDSPNNLITLDLENRRRWRLQGTFLPIPPAVSRNGRWLAALAEAVPDRGPRGRGLLLVDTQSTARGHDRLVYTYSTPSTPLPTLAMALDGSAIAFAEFRPAAEPAGHGAIVVNVIR